jgi:hypothetical protein
MPHLLTLRHEGGWAFGALVCVTLGASSHLSCATGASRRDAKQSIKAAARQLVPQLASLEASMAGPPGSARVAAFKPYVPGDQAGLPAPSFLVSSLLPLLE